jgi:RNA polymerase sigma-70 factor, ECF subfamily
VDAWTIEEARRGNREAQARLLGALQDPWYRLAMSLCRDAEFARDATQETAVRFLRELPNFKQQSQLQTWSFGIAINVVREMRRSQGRTPDENRLAASQREALPAPPMLAQLAEDRAILHSALTDLPERQREAIVLRYFEELSIDDAAKAMNCAVGTVKATIHQALRALRTRLQQLN